LYFDCCQRHISSQRNYSTSFKVDALMSIWAAFKRRRSRFRPHWRPSFVYVRPGLDVSCWGVASLFVCHSSSGGMGQLVPLNNQRPSLVTKLTRVNMHVNRPIGSLCIFSTRPLCFVHRRGKKDTNSLISWRRSSGLWLLRYTNIAVLYYFCQSVSLLAG
jgi:hypothetical protein